MRETKIEMRETKIEMTKDKRDGKIIIEMT